MIMSIADLRVIVERVRAEAAAADELRPPKAGAVRLDVPDTIRTALLIDWASGVYNEAARAATLGDPEMLQV